VLRNEARLSECAQVVRSEAKLHGVSPGGEERGRVIQSETRW
jgi:hypothetical protein